MVKSTFNVTVVGEAFSGKSHLLSALVGKEVPRVTRQSRSNFWDTQFKGETGKMKTNFEGKDYSLNFTEIIGSRGRMSNSYALATSIKKADAVLYCISMKEYAAWKIRALHRITHTIGTSNNRSCKVIVVGTHADEKDDSLDPTKETRLKKWAFVPTSAYSREGLDELVSTIMKEIKTGTPAFDIAAEIKKEEEEERQKQKEREEEERLKKEEEERQKEKEAANNPILALFKGTADEDLPPNKRAKLENEALDIAPVA